MLRSTTIPRLTVMPASSGMKSTLGRTPMAKTTMSQSTLSPSRSTAWSTRPAFPTISSADVPVLRSTPACRRMVSASFEAVRSKLMLRMRSASSTTVTFTERSSSASVVFRPISPPPTTRADSTPRFSMKLSICRASSHRVKVKTPSRSTPGSGGTNGIPPVAMSRRS